MAAEHRAVRQEMSSMPNTRAKKILAEYAALIKHIAKSGPAAEREDLIAIGNIAVIEAHVTWVPSRAIKGKQFTLPGWVRQVVSWRCAEFLRRDQEVRATTVSLQEPTTYHTATDPSGFQVALEDTLADVNAVCPETYTTETQTIESMRTQIAHLATRDQMVLDADMRGETLEVIAGSLGITKQRVSQIKQGIHKRLRHRCTVESEYSLALVGGK